MKKIFLFLILCFFIIPVGVRADRMYRVDIDIDILKDGTANITEVWDVKADGGSEWYKQLYNLNNSELSDFFVYMDGKKLEWKDWNINDGLSEKSGYYGINYEDAGIELCFGKSDMKRHTFTLEYTLSNYVFNTSDSQVLYWTLMPNAIVDNFSVEVSSYYSFPDNLDVWGYGYRGYSYVENGKIKMSNNGSLDNEYVTLLVKFPLNTFNTDNRLDDYNTFNDVYNLAENGSYEYDNTSILDKVMTFIIYGICILIIIMAIVFMFYSFFDNIGNGYGYVGNKKINKKNVPMFRDIPCNKDIYYANILIKLNDFGYNKSNILGAIILKWVKNNKIVFKNDQTGIFNKETSVIDLTNNSEFDNDIERRLFSMMKDASKDGILESKEFEKWCKNNYSEFLGLFNRIENDTISELRSKDYIYNRNNKDECKCRNVMTDMMYNDSVNLYGLKKYLDEFSKIDTKEVIEVHLWDEYLMFAYLFGIADKVVKQLKEMYPDVLEQINYNYDTIVFIDHMSTRSVSAANDAKYAADAYSAGGGGFSSGGGGGGSFGGGGSMGGR